MNLNRAFWIATQHSIGMIKPIRSHRHHEDSSASKGQKTDETSVSNPNRGMWTRLLSLDSKL